MFGFGSIGGGGGGGSTPQNYQQVLDEDNVATLPAIHAEGGASAVLDESGLVVSNPSNASAQVAPNLVALSADGSGQVVLREIGVGAGSFDVYFRRMAGTVALLTDLVVQMLPNSVKLNNAPTSENPIDFVINPNSLLGRGITGDITNIPITDFLLSNAPLGNILFVSQNAPLANDAQTRAEALGRIDRPFKTIQAAVNAAQFNGWDTIVIFEGTYLESVDLGTTAIDIIGVGKVKIIGFYATYNGFKKTKVVNIEFTGAVYIYELFGNSRDFIFEKCKFPAVTYILASFRSNGAYYFYDCDFVDFNPANGWTPYFELHNCKIQSINVVNSIIFSKWVLKNCTINYCNLDESGVSIAQKNFWQFENCKFITTAPQNMQLVNSPTVKTLNCVSNKPFNPLITNNHNSYSDPNLI